MRAYNLPKDEIRLAAKTGFLSRRLWQKYNLYHSRSGAYYRWKSFVDKGIFLPYHRDRSGQTLVLNPKSPLTRSVIRGGYVKPPHPMGLRHDEKVVDIVLDMHKAFQFDEYYFSDQIRSCPMVFNHNRYDNIPDAILIKDEKSYAIEVELSRKHTKRYRKAMKAYAMSDNYEAIYYFVIDDQIERHLVTAAEKVEYNFDDTPIFFHQIRFESEPLIIRTLFEQVAG